MVVTSASVRSVSTASKTTNAPRTNALMESVHSRQMRRRRSASRPRSLNAVVVTRVQIVCPLSVMTASVSIPPMWRIASVSNVPNVRL